MMIRSGDVCLTAITMHDIELLRNWRNSSRVNQYLLTTDFITPRQQLEWFRSLNPATAVYFMLRVGDIPVGLVYGNKINQVELSFEGSIFIGDMGYMDTHYPVKAALLLSYYFFEHLGFNKAYSTVHMENHSALELDKRLGYKQVSTDNGFVRSVCTKQDYMISAMPFRKILFRDGLPEIIV
jgi:RimJ/RimL family protein N-acetyltransferase